MEHFGLGGFVSGRGKFTQAGAGGCGIAFFDGSQDFLAQGANAAFYRLVACGACLCAADVFFRGTDVGHKRGLREGGRCLTHLGGAVKRGFGSQSSGLPGMTHFTDEASTLTAGITAFCFLGKRKDDFVIQGWAPVVTAQEHAEADDGRFEEEIFTR